MVVVLLADGVVVVIGRLEGVVSLFTLLPAIAAAVAATLALTLTLAVVVAVVTGLDGDRKDVVGKGLVFKGVTLLLTRTLRRGLLLVTVKIQLTVSSEERHH